MRLRTAILPLFTALVVPAFGETATNSCQSWNASSCEAEFALARNAEIEASIAAVAKARLQPPSRSSCESADASLSPCQGEPAASFAAERNAEINASIAAVTAAREQTFAEARNAEIEASILTVKATRESEFALRRTSCESPEANLPPCEGEVAANFAKARNAEIDASIAAVAVERERRFAQERNAEITASLATVKAARESEFALRRTSCESPEANLPPCEGEVAANFAKSRNAEIDASIAVVAEEHERAFAEARNTEITASLEAVKAAREREFAAARTSCESPDANLPPCEGDVAANFAKARNAEIDASIAVVAEEHERAFAEARNAEVTASLEAVKAARERDYAEARTTEMMAWVSAIRGDRTQRFAQARNAEIDASIAAVKAAREFAAARNAEINASVALVTAARERSFAEARNIEIESALSAYRAERTIRSAQALTQKPAAGSQAPSIETGAIRVPEVPVEPILPLRHSIGTEPCPAAGIPLSPVQFSGPGATVDDAMKPGLDTIAAIARDCPAVRIEIHGYSDTSAAADVSQLLSELRAKAAMAYLASVGVAENRMTAIGHGDMIPLAANTTPENRALNRRVEFTIKDPALQAGVKRVMWDLSELLDPTYLPQLARLSP